MNGGAAMRANRRRGQTRDYQSVIQHTGALRSVGGAQGVIESCLFAARQKDCPQGGIV